MRWLDFFRAHREVLAENWELRERVVTLAQECDAQRGLLRSAAEDVRDLECDVRERDATVVELQGLVADLARDMDALVGITEDGA